jgi:hypothetical protein
MMLVNGNKLDLGVLSDANKKGTSEYSQAKFYKDKVEELRSTYGKFMRFVDVNQPRFCSGADARGVAIPNMAEPPTIVRIPLEKYVAMEDRGREKWSCCLRTPKLLPNNMWDLGDERAVTIKGDKLINLDTDADLAFYLTYISGFVKGKRLRIDDPKLTAKKIGDKRRDSIKRETAIWQMLAEEDKLRTVAQAYGVMNVHKKEPDDIRVELEKLLESNDKAKKNNPMIKGTDDFLNDLKVTENVILRAFIQNAIDEKKLSYKGDGYWRVGEKLILKVPQEYIEVDKRFNYICNYLGSTNNNDKLLDFLGDLITPEYLKDIKDNKTFLWLAKTNNINVVAQKPEKIKSAVLKHYGIGESSDEE